jgi:hypothetical protein
MSSDGGRMIRALTTSASIENFVSYANQFQLDFNSPYLAGSQTYQQVKSSDIINSGRPSKPEILIPSLRVGRCWSIFSIFK